MTTDDSLEELLDELDGHGDLATGTQVLTISVEERRYGKAMTIVEGFDADAVDVTSVASELKRSLATGGTTTDGRIELQGDHTDRVPELLRDRGFRVDG
ncbi:stress response translation initiation inhibitor YciH [Natronobeatus ordinarius]|uniref:stress response translation initiation inhibitor YciH n=1 Tax=Natronobeatus ordinarius TaxID=2963433 RepID=UPI0020CE1385|nr:stress response translation initiation inhibitor YciH [Natronobeatus ordinarius]